MSETNEQISEPTKEAPLIINSIKEFKEKHGIDSVGLTSLHKPDNKPNIVIVTTTYHRDITGESKSLATRSVRNSNSSDEVFFRKTVKVNEEWIELDTAWVDKIGYIHIRNNGSKPFQVVPTEEQAREAQSKILEIGYRLKLPDENLPERKYSDNVKRTKRTMWDAPIPKEIVQYPEILPLWLVHPGECHTGKPINGIPIYLRSPNGEITISIFASPD